MITSVIRGIARKVQDQQVSDLPEKSEIEWDKVKYIFSCPGCFWTVLYHNTKQLTKNTSLKTKSETEEQEVDSPREQIPTAIQEMPQAPKTFSSPFIITLYLLYMTLFLFSSELVGYKGARFPKYCIC